MEEFSHHRAFDIEKTILSARYSDARGYTSAMDHGDILDRRARYEASEAEVSSRCARDAAASSCPPGMRLVYMFGWQPPGSHGALPRGVVFSWPARSPVGSGDFGYPMSHAATSMFSGYTLVELEPYGQDMKLLHDSEYDAMARRLASSYADLCIPPGRADAYDAASERYGLLMPGELRDTICERHVSRFNPTDSVASLWNPCVTSSSWVSGGVGDGSLWSEGSPPTLLDTARTGDFVSMFRGTWDALSKENKAERGYNTGNQGNKHYMVVYWETPPHLTDQFLHVVRERAGSWGGVVDHPEFARFSTFARRARERILRTACALAGATPRVTENGRGFFHTTLNTMWVHDDRVCFGSECAASSEPGGSIIADVAPSPPPASARPSTLLWVHGAYEVGSMGGHGWAMPATGGAMPTDTGHHGTINTEFMKHVSACGEVNKRNGHVKLVRINAQASDGAQKTNDKMT